MHGSGSGIWSGSETQRKVLLVEKAAPHAGIHQRYHLFINFILLHFFRNYKLPNLRENL